MEHPIQARTFSAQEHIQYVKDYKLLACKVCQHCVWPEHVQQHFQGAQHRWKKRDANQLAIAVQSWPDVISSDDGFDVLNSINELVSELPVFDDGLRCQVATRQCQYVCRTVRSMKQHCQEKHGWSQQMRRDRPSKNRQSNELTEPWQAVRCQRFFVQGPGSHYYTVRDRVPIARQQTENVIPVWQQAEQAMNDAWQTADEREKRFIAEGEVSEMNPWLERTGWHRYLVELDREELIQSIARLDEADESVAARMWSTMESMTRHCQQTATSEVGHFVRMEVIRTEKHQTKYHPLQPYQNVQSFGNYVRAWQQVLMFFVRSKDHQSQQEPNVTWKVPKYRFNQRQRQAWRRFATAVEAAIQESAEHSQHSIDSDNEQMNDESSSTHESESERSLKPVEKSCLTFCISLLDQQITRHEYDSPLMCALAVLGVEKGGWLGPDRYPPILSAIIKISRMMVVQQAWEKHGRERSRGSSVSSNSQVSIGVSIDHVSNSEVSNNAESFGILQEVKEMTNRFMIRGSQSSTQWMLDLRTYGLKIHYNTTTQSHVDWVEDQILYKQIQFSMTDFRSMIHDLVERTERLLMNDLLFRPKKIVGAEPLPPIL